MAVPILAFVGPSGSGKTTFLTKVVSHLAQKGLRVGVAKHTHHGFEMDRSGKDTWRYTHAGAQGVLAIGPTGLAFLERHVERPKLGPQLQKFFIDKDVILLEGFQWSDYPKVVVVGAPGIQPMTEGGPQWAWIADSPQEGKLPTFPRRTAVPFCDFLLDRLGLSL